jgi:pyruvate dehydrogenase E1 component beta subunit
LKAAIRDDNPCVFLESELLYTRTFPVSSAVLQSDFVLPIGQAHIQREGTDITIVTYSNAVNHSMEAAEELANEHGIQAEVGDWKGREFLHLSRIVLVKDI